MVKLITKYFLIELMIIYGFLLTVKTYVGYADETIKSDGIGYYEYLPSLFIHHDFVRKDIPFSQNPSFYDRIEKPGPYVEYNDYRVNKYPCGTAILQLPFFTYAYLTTDLADSPEDGYQQPFHQAIFYATIFFLFLGVFMLKKIMQLFKIPYYLILFSQVLLVFATSITHYANEEASYSHVYSIFAVSLFIYYTKLFFDKKQMRHFVFACASLGLTFILRNPNLLIVFFTFFLAGSKQNFIAGLRFALKNRYWLILGLFSFFTVAFIQLLAWYLQTGSFLIYSYQGEGFDNLYSPEFYHILFSYKKGLFIYTPILFLATLSVCWFAYKRDFYLFFSWVFFFVLLTYILSSWHSWYYGCSYGLRAYIDYYPVFLLPFAMVLNKINYWFRLTIILISLLTIPINIIQTYQYKAYILHWIDMDKEKYWKVFLRTEDRFSGLVWKEDKIPEVHVIERELALGDFILPKNTIKDVFSISSQEIPNFNQILAIQVTLDDTFKDTDDARVIIKIDDLTKQKNHYWQGYNILFFNEEGLNNFHQGIANYEFSPITDEEEKVITLELNTADEDKTFKNIRLSFISQDE